MPLLIHFSNPPAEGEASWMPHELLIWVTYREDPLVWWEKF